MHVLRRLCAAPILFRREYSLLLHTCFSSNQNLIAKQSSISSPDLLENDRGGTKTETSKRLLCKFGDSKASDPRDNVYALLGLSSDAYKSSHLAANYKINLDEVIKQTLSFILRYHDVQIQLQRLPEGFVWTDFPRNLEALSTALLRQAVEENRAQEVDLFLGHDVINANAVDSHGRTPLYVGALSGLKDIVDLFFQKSTISANPVDIYGRTLLLQQEKIRLESNSTPPSNTGNTDLQWEQSHFRPMKLLKLT